MVPQKLIIDLEFFDDPVTEHLCIANALKLLNE